MTITDNTTTFPTLYKRNSNGSTQQWTISVEGSTITKVYGQVGGSLQTAADHISEGKNIGRSNETTPEEQAVLEAQSQWERKQKKGYNVDSAAARSGAVDTEFVTGGIDPMLAHPYPKRGKDITWPAMAQPKLDGHRCIAIVEPDGVTLWSRTRKPITGVPHIAQEIERLELPVGTVLDGELYNHDYRDNFEELTSFIRQATPKPGHEVVQYHIYDLPSEEGAGFLSRFEALYVMIGADSPVLVLVETVRVHSYGTLQERFSEYLAAGYEGAMVRNINGTYVGKRSTNLQKVKEWDDAEFKIVGVEEGRGRMAGLAVFTCETAAGTTFAVKMKGSLESLRQYVQDPSLAIGKLLTVQYQGLTAANELPRFPIGLRIREDV
jgi:ATP-dependent DNA ligase